MKARKKPVVVEVVQFKVLCDTKNVTLNKCLDFVGSNKCYYSQDEKAIIIKTLEGEMLAMDGDYIIKGVEGEFYPCKPDIFEKTYDIIEA